MPKRISVLARIRVLLQQPIGPRDHARRAEAALQAMHLAEALLQRMQRAVGSRDALDGEDLGALGLDREDGAGFDRLAVEIDGAGAAMAGVAADMRAGQVQLLAQEMDQKRARLDQRFDRLAVDLHRDLGLGHMLSPLRTRAALAAARARASITPAILRAIGRRSPIVGSGRGDGLRRGHRLLHDGRHPGPSRSGAWRPPRRRAASRRHW